MSVDDFTYVIVCLHLVYKKKKESGVLPTGFKYFTRIIPQRIWRCNENAAFSVYFNALQRLLPQTCWVPEVQPDSDVWSVQSTSLLLASSHQCNTQRTTGLDYCFNVLSRWWHETSVMHWLLSWQRHIWCERNLKLLNSPGFFALLLRSFKVIGSWYLYPKNQHLARCFRDAVPRCV